MRLELAVDTVPMVTCRHYPDTKPEPKLQISPDFTWCSDAFRLDFNDWLRRRFGEQDPLVEVLTTYELVERSDEGPMQARSPGEL